MLIKFPPLLTVALLSLFSLLLLSGCRSSDIQASAENPDTWELVWSDEFDYEGLPDPAKWTYAIGGHGWGNKELQYYTKERRENAFVEDGRLHISAIKEEWEGNAYTSARLITRGMGDFYQGRFEIRARLPEALGTWSAIWMMPSDWKFEDGNWPNIGEIDIMEHVGSEVGMIHASAHSRDYQWQKGTQKTGTLMVEEATEAFHTYVLEWTDEFMRAYVDDEMYFEYFNEGLGPDKWPYVKPFYLILNIAVGGAWGGANGIDEAAFPQVMEVDYVRVFRSIKD